MSAELNSHLQLVQTRGRLAQSGQGFQFADATAHLAMRKPEWIRVA